MRVTIVDACVRPGRGGGSPTAVVVDDGTQTDGTLTDDERKRVPARYGTSHAAFIGPELEGSHPVRFFTTGAELAGCGHGTIAAQAVLLKEDGMRDGRQRTGGRTFDTRTARRPDGIEVWFDQGIIAVRSATPDDCEAVLAALGIGAAQLHPYVRMVIASPGTPRLLVPVSDRDLLAALTPDFPALGSATRERGLLGCFVFVPPGEDRPAAARMFAPAIGVDEDVANANSTGCLAAHLRPDGPIEVEQGDALGRPATVSATIHSGRVWVGGLAVIRGPDLG
jgi:PhzF family phenazine biosynthesis protein